MSAPVAILLKLSDGHWVNALDICEVRVNYDADKVVVHLRGGAVYHCSPPHKMHIKNYEAQLVSHVNEAAIAYGGHFVAAPQFRPHGT